MRAPVYQIADTEKPVAIGVKTNFGKGSLESPRAAVDVTDHEVTPERVGCECTNPEGASDSRTLDDSFIAPPGCLIRLTDAGKTRDLLHRFGRSGLRARSPAFYLLQVNSETLGK